MGKVQKRIVIYLIVFLFAMAAVVTLAFMQGNDRRSLPLRPLPAGYTKEAVYKLNNLKLAILEPVDQAKMPNSGITHARTIKFAAIDVTRIEPPAEAASMQRKINEEMQTCMDAGDQTEIMIKNIDASMIPKVDKLISDCGAAVGVALAVLEH